MSYSEIYVAIASVSTIAVAGLLVLCLVYILSILYDIKRLSKIARREAEMIARGIAKGASIFGADLSQETASFLKTLFTILLSQFGVIGAIKNRRVKREKIKSI